MAEVVGTAYVRIRAITSGLSKDIERGLKKGLKDSDLDAVGKEAGDKFAKSASDQLEKGLGKGVKDVTKNIDKKVDVDGGRKAGDRLGKGFRDGLSKALPDDFFSKVGARVKKALGLDKKSGDSVGKAFSGGIRGNILKLGAVLSPALAGTVSLIVQYVAALVAQIGLLIQASVAGGAAIAGAFGAAALGAAALFAAFKVNTPQLKKFKTEAGKIGKEWQAFGKATQKDLLPGLTQALSLTKRLIPQFSAFGGAVGRIVGNQAAFLSGLISSNEGQSRLGEILLRSVPLLETMGRIVIRLGDILSQLFVAVLPLSQQFADSLEKMVTKWQEAVNVDGGDRIAMILQQWYDRAKLVFGALGDLLAAMGNIINVGADSAVPFFENFANWAADFRAFTESAAGQNKLKQIFDDALEVAHAFNGLIVDIARRIGGGIFEEGGNEGILKFIDILRQDVVPFLDTVFRDLIDNLGPALVDFADKFAELLKALDESGTLRLLIETMTALIDVLTTLISIPGFNTLIVNLGSLLAVFGLLKKLGVVQLVKVLGSGLKFLVGALVPLAAAIGGLFGATGIGALAIGFGVIVAIIAVVVGAVILLVKNWDKIKGAFAATVRFLKDPMARLERLGELLKDLAGFVGRNLGKALSIAGKALVKFGSAVKERLEDAIGKAVEFLKGVPAKLLQLGIDMATSLIRGLIGVVQRAPGLIIDALTRMFTIAWNVFKTVVSRLIEQLILSFILIPYLIFQALMFLGPKLLDAFQAGFDFLKAAIPALFETVLNFFRDLPGNIVSAISTLGSAIADFFTQTAWPAVVTVTTNAVTALVDFFKKLPGRIVDALSSLAGLLKGIFEDATGAIVDFLSALPGKIMEFAGTIGSAILALGETIINKLLEGIGAAPEAIAGLASDIFDAVRGLGKDLINGVITALNELLPDEIGKVKVAGKTIFPGLDLPDNPIPKLARGGIFDRATPAIVGEAGKEVVIPLNRPSRALQLARESGLFDVLSRASGSSGAIVFELGTGAIQVSIAGNITDSEAKQIGTNIVDGMERRLRERRFAVAARAQ